MQWADADAEPSVAAYELPTTLNRVAAHDRSVGLGTRCDGTACPRAEPARQSRPTSRHLSLGGGRSATTPAATGVDRSKKADHGDRRFVHLPTCERMPPARGRRGSNATPFRRSGRWRRLGLGDEPLRLRDLQADLVRPVDVDACCRSVVGADRAAEVAAEARGAQIQRRHPRNPRFRLRTGQQPFPAVRGASRRGSWCVRRS
jgi:hypothetical protein